MNERYIAFRVPLGYSTEKARVQELQNPDYSTRTMEVLVFQSHDGDSVHVELLSGMYTWTVADRTDAFVILEGVEYVN